MCEIVMRRTSDRILLFQFGMIFCKFCSPPHHHDGDLLQWGLV
jgi:hypothetical protein